MRPLTALGLLASLVVGGIATRLPAAERAAESKCYRIGDSVVSLAATLRLKSDFLVVMGGTIEHARELRKVDDHYLLELDSPICVWPSHAAEARLGPYRNILLLAVASPPKRLEKLLARRVHGKVTVTATLTERDAVGLLSVQ